MCFISKAAISLTLNAALYADRDTPRQSVQTQTFATKQILAIKQKLNMQTEHRHGQHLQPHPMPAALRRG